MPEVFAGIGSNEDREHNVREGLRLLRESFGTLRVSTVWNAPAVGFDGEDFLNLAVAFETDLDPEALVDRLHTIEAACGRQRASDERMRARTLDIDLLLYGDAVIHRGKVDVPRPEILEHAYVLVPLAELAPDFKHPEDGRSIAAILAQFPGERGGLTPAE